MKMSKEEYTNWMCNPKNEYQCDECPENQGFSDWGGNFVCGQQNCWVTIHCKERN